METLTRNEAIDFIADFESNAYTGEETQTKTSKSKLNALSNEELIAFIEDMTTNYGGYKIEEA